MRYQVIVYNNTDSSSAPDREHIADFRHRQHAIAFCQKITARAYVVDCFDDTVDYNNAN
jgi:cytochrome c oxidase subunit IV